MNIFACDFLFPIDNAGLQINCQNSVVWWRSAIFSITKHAMTLATATVTTIANWKNRKIIKVRLSVNANAIFCKLHIVLYNFGSFFFFIIVFILFFSVLLFLSFVLRLFSPFFMWPESLLHKCMPSFATTHSLQSTDFHSQSGCLVNLPSHRMFVCVCVCAPARPLFWSYNQLLDDRLTNDMRIWYGNLLLIFGMEDFNYSRSLWFLLCKCM